MPRQEGGGGGSIVEQCPTFLSGFATSVLIQANTEVLIIGDQENCIKKTQISGDFLVLRPSPKRGLVIVLFKCKQLRWRQNWCLTQTPLNPNTMVFKWNVV